MPILVYPMEDYNGEWNSRLAVVMAKAIPTGVCWCGCGIETRRGSWFLQGHDKRAQRYLQAIDDKQHIAEQLADRGYIPGSGKDIRADTLAADSSYEECGLLRPDGKPCLVIGRGGQNMHKHRADDKQHQVK